MYEIERGRQQEAGQQKVAAVKQLAVPQALRTDQEKKAHAPVEPSAGTGSVNVSNDSRSPRNVGCHSTWARHEYHRVTAGAKVES